MKNNKKRLIKKVILLKNYLHDLKIKKYIPKNDNKFLFLLYEFDYNILNSINDIIKTIKNNKFEKLIDNVLNQSLNHNLICELLSNINQI